MRAMPLSLVVLMSLAAGSAAAQVAPRPPIAPGVGLQQELTNTMRDAQLRAQMDLAARQAVVQQGQLFSLESQLRTDEAIARLRAQGQPIVIPPPPPTRTLRHIDVSGLASIPDATLADSDAKVRAAADNHR